MIKHTLSDKLGILKAPKNNCNSLKALIVGNHPSFIKGGGGGGVRTFQKLSHWGGGKDFATKRG